MLGELPYITSLYERGRRELLSDDNLAADGVKEMVLEAREVLKEKHPRTAERITPQLLSIYLRYIRNLSLLDRRLTPDLYTLIVAAKQTGGDDFALAVARIARSYAHALASPGDSAGEPAFEEPGLARMGIDRAELPVWGTGRMVSRLPGRTISWRTCELRPQPDKQDQARWRQRWDPFGMCSHPPEDDRIESFHRHVRDQAKALIGADLARTEKFTTSVRDGIDIRETLRNWHKGDLYVKVVPPSRGSIEVVIFLFDEPADPAVYTSRTTWYAEHLEESTLAFYATDPMKNMVGPGIAQAEYGGALFIFPPGRSRTSGPTSGWISRPRWKSGCWPRGFCTARIAMSRWSAGGFPRHHGGGWPRGSAARSSTCRSRGSALRYSSVCASFTS